MAHYGLDMAGFSPLPDMMNAGYLWRLWCNRMLTTEAPGNHAFLNMYLTKQKAARDSLPAASPKQPGIPSTIKKFSPAPHSPKRYGQGDLILTQQKLDDELQEDSVLTSTVTSMASKTTLISNHTTSTIYTVDGRRPCF
jgi:hypothetical protein